MSVAVTVMTKTPGHSPVKTRLADSVGTPYATEVHRRSARATASIIAQVARRHDVTAYWAIAEPTAAAAAAWPAAEIAGFERIHQPAGDLGERMAQLHSTLVLRHGAAILVGTDSPQMEARQIERAVDWLSAGTPRSVLGPAADGGFWLFGGNRTIPPDEWSRVPWSVESTGSAFTAMIAPYGELLRLPVLCDIDVAGDLDRLLASLRELAVPTAPQQTLLHWLEARAE